MLKKNWYKGFSFGLSFCMAASSFAAPVKAFAMQQPAANVLRTEVLDEKVNDAAKRLEENLLGAVLTNQTVKVSSETAKAGSQIALAANEVKIESEDMSVVVDKEFPRVVRYEMKNSKNASDTVFYGQTEKLTTVTINGVDVKPKILECKTENDKITYKMELKNSSDKANPVDAVITAEFKVSGNILEFNITDIVDNKIVKTIEFKNHSLVSVRSSQKNAKLNGAAMSVNTHINGDREVAVDKNLDVEAEEKQGYMYAFVSNGSYSAGLWSNSENNVTKDWQRVTASATELKDGTKTMGLSSTTWTYQKSEEHRKEDGTLEYSDGTVLKVEGELPSTKIVITPDINGDKVADWQDGAIAYRSIMNNPVGSERVPNLVAYRICMNFSGQAQNPFLMTLDNVKKVYWNTDGLGQSILLKGYGSEGHDSGHLNYADIGTRIGGAEDMKYLLEKGAELGATFGIHVNASETYPESKYFNDDILRRDANGNPSYGWNWLDQGININADYDLRNGRADRWKDLIEALGGAPAKQDGAGLDFIYVDVWGNGQSGDNGTWASRQIAKELTTLGWRVAGEWGYANEYDSTFQHWAADLTYGGYSLKGINSTITRFIRNHQKDSWVGNYTSYGGAADAPLLGGYNMKDFEGWQGRSDYAAYINTLFEVNVPSKFVQHFEVMNWVDGEPVTMTDNGETYQWTPGMEATLTSLDQYVKNGNKSTLNIKRKSNDFEKDTTGYRTRTMTLDGKKVYEGYEGDVKYLIPWNWDDKGNILDDAEDKLYHWNTKGGSSTWELPAGWNVSTVKVYSLDDLGKTFVKEVAVKNNKITLNADEKTPYVIYKGTAKDSGENKEFTWSDGMHLRDVGFNSGSLSPYWSVSGGKAEITKSQGANPMLKIADNTAKVTVSQKMTDLKPNTKYAVYVGVDNRSGSNVGIEITGADGTKTKTEAKTSIAKNYISAYAHNTKQSVATVDNTSYFQNMYAFFETGANVNDVEVTIYKEAGSGASYFDDIRVVETKADNWDKWESDGIFTQDFENVAQGVYPFVIGNLEGVIDNRTHLSEYHAPYTQRGWNNKMLDDVIDGNWSLKTNGLSEYQNLVYQTIPQNFAFEPGQSYLVSFDYEAGSDGTYAFVVGDKPYEESGFNTRVDLDGTAVENPKSGSAKHFVFNVVGSESGNTWVGIYSTEIAPDLHGLTESGPVNFSGYKDFTLDNLEIRKTDVNKTDLWNAVKEVEGKIEAFYTTDSYKNYTDAIAHAMSVYQDVNAAQEAADKAAADLRAANKALTEVTATKTLLQSTIRNCEKYRAEDYSDSGYTKFLVTVNYAKDAVASENPPQALLTKAYKELILAEMELANDEGPSGAKNEKDISTENLTVEAGSFQPGGGGEGLAEYAVDGQENTLWHSLWDGDPIEKRWFEFKLNSPETVDGLRYLPRPSGDNGKILEFEILISKDNGATYTKVAEGSWDKSVEWKTVEFEAQEDVTNVRLKPTSTVGDYSAAAELHLTGPAKTDQEAPKGLTATADSGSSTGKIANVTDAMEYTTDLSGTYQQVTGTEITGLAEGDYYVRYKATKTQKESIPTKVTVFDEEAAPIVSETESTVSTINTIVTKDSGNIVISVAENEIKKVTDAATAENKASVAIAVPNKEITEALNNSSTKAETAIIELPAAFLENENIKVSNLVLGSEILETVKSTGKDLTVTIKDNEKNVLYTWEVKAEDVKNTAGALKNMNLNVNVVNGKREYSATGQSIHITLGEKGILPVQASVKVLVGTENDFASKKVYVYYKNAETGKLETLPYSNLYEVDKDGYLTLNVLQNGEYVVLKTLADNSIVSNFGAQIKVSDELSLNAGQTAKLSVKLPITLELTQTVDDKTKSSAVGAVAISYESTNNAVASVAADGTITATAAGNAEILTTVHYYTGGSRIYRTAVTVK